MYCFPGKHNHCSYICLIICLNRCNAYHQSFYTLISSSVSSESGFIFWWFLLCFQTEWLISWWQNEWQECYFLCDVFGGGPFLPGDGNSFPAVTSSGEQHPPPLLGFPQLLSVVPASGSPVTQLEGLLFPARTMTVVASASPSSLCPLPPVPFLFGPPSLLPLPLLPPFFSLLKLGDRPGHRLVYLAPHLVCGCPCPWVVKNRVFLLSALLEILADFQNVQPIVQPWQPHPHRQPNKAHSSVLCFLPYRKPILFPSLISWEGGWDQICYLSV